MWDAFLYYDCSVDATLLRLVTEHDHYIFIPFMNDNNEIP